MGANLVLGVSILGLVALVTLPIWALMFGERHLRRLGRAPRRTDPR